MLVSKGEGKAVMNAERIIKISLRISLSSRETELLKRVLDAYYEDHPERWQPYAGVLDVFRQHISHCVECTETVEMIPLEIYYPEAMLSGPYVATRIPRPE